ncbi:hypothetical protein [Streptococcus alactolyticus]|uniref:hypothetical protein n=1 Tax=Streptococcus alactolyticus TaxID=29389 RepID=UPI003752B141
MAYDFNSLTKQADEATNRDGFYTDFEDVDPSKLHQISELTEWMRTKGKGSDVREVIAQLFERTWIEGTKEGNANLEVAKARGSYGTLGERLTQSDQSVANLFGKVATHSSQIENIIASAGDGTLPTELVDVRTLSNGKTYATAGEATRAIDEKIKDMPKTIKNIITNVQVGKYWSNRTIGQDGTALGNHADYTAYTIPVTPGSIISSNIEMISPYSHFLDASKKAISTLDSTKQSNFVYRVPDNAQWLYVTINKSTATLVVVNHPNLAAGKSYTDCLPGTVLGYEVDDVFLSKSDFTTLANVSGLPKILKNEVIQVFEKTYWSNRDIGQDGTVRKSHDDYTAYIVKVTPNTKISSNVDLPSPFTHFLNAGKQNLALLDSYVDSSQDGYVYNVPSDAEWLYVTRNHKKLELVVIEGAKDIRDLSYSQYPAGTFYGFNINGAIYPFAETTGTIEYIDLKVGTDKPYQTIKQALDAVVASGPNRIYTIVLDDGTHDFSMLGDRLPDYVHIKSASGEPTRCIIRGDVPDSADDNTITQTSTINVSRNNNFEGITVTGRNCRYVIHDESSGVHRNWTRLVKNCRFIHYGNKGARDYRTQHGGDASKVWQVTRAWGEGASEGSYSQYDNCYFESPVQPWYVHEPNAADSTKPYHKVHNNCTFVSTAVEYGGFGGGINVDNTNDRGGAIHMIDFNNCNFSNCPIKINGQYPIKVRVFGCNETFIEAEYPINYPETDYTVKRYYNSEKALIGGEVLAVSQAGFNYVELATPTTPQSMIAGIYIGTSANRGDSIRVLTPTLFASKLSGAFGSQMYVGQDSKLTLTPANYPVGIFLGGKDKLFKN